MFQTVLVPLDGSKLAEKSLTYVENLAKEGSIAEVIFLNVVEIPSMWLSKGFNISSLKNELSHRAQRYLADIESRFKSKGLKIRTEILEGEAAQCIVEQAKKLAVDLIVIGTHGYTGMKGVVFGSVALKVLHDSHIPVLLIR